MSRGQAAPGQRTPLASLAEAVRDRDLTPLEAVLATDAQVRVPGLAGWSWSTYADRGRAWERLLDAVPDLRYEPHRRYLSPDLHGEEGVLTGTVAGPGGGPEPLRMPVRVLAKVEQDRITQLEVTGPLSALPPSLRPVLPASAATYGDMLALQQAADDVEGLRVLGSTVAVAEPAVAEPAVAEPVEPSHDEQPEERRGGAVPRRRRALLVVAMAVGAVAVGTGLVTLAPGGTPPSRVGPQAAPAPSATEPPQSAAPSPAPDDAVPEIAQAAPDAPLQVQAGEQLVLRSDVLFGSDSAELTPQAQAALEELAGTIRARGVTGIVQVNGYTDSTGTDAYDLALSRARALAVAQVLQRSLTGLPVTLQTQGFGKADPVADNGTEAGRAQNRRVTVILPAAG